MSTAANQKYSRPSAASGISLIVKRELMSYFGTRSGYVVAAVTLLIAGLAFNTRAVGSTARYSRDVLSTFLYDTSGIVMAAAILISLRLIAEERKTGTIHLLMNSALSEGQIVLAKFLSAYLFLAILILLTAYMPALIFLRGRVSLGHIVTGYLGLLLLGAAVVAIGTFASSLTRSQVIAAVFTTVITALLVLMWVLAKVVDPPLKDVVTNMALHNIHFRTFQQGTLSSRDVVYYLSVTGVFLFMARNALEARRWTL